MGVLPRLRIESSSAPSSRLPTHGKRLHDQRRQKQARVEARHGMRKSDAHPPRGAAPPSIAQLWGSRHSRSSAAVPTQPSCSSTHARLNQLPFQAWLRSASRWPAANCVAAVSACCSTWGGGSLLADGERRAILSASAPARTADQAIRRSDAEGSGCLTAVKDARGHGGVKRAL